MHQLFSFHRFWLVIKLYYTEHGKSYLISFGLIISVMLLLMLPILRTQYYNELLMILHAVALFACVLVGGSLFTSTAFTAYSNPMQGIPTLMLPASRLEKFLVIWFFHLLLTVIIIVVFWQLHHWLTDAANQNIPDGSRNYQPIPTDPATFFTYIHFLIHGVIFLGSIYFIKNVYIKTAGIFLVVLIVVFLFNIALAYQFTGYPKNLHTFPFTSWTIFRDRAYWVAYPETVEKMVWAFLVFLVVSLWLIAYVRLKEK